MNTTTIASFVPQGYLRFFDADDLSDLKYNGFIEQFLTIMFTDMRSFTDISESMSATENVALLDDYFSKVLPHINANGGIVDKFLGDCVLSVFPGGVNAAIQAAQQIQLDHGFKCSETYSRFLGSSIHSCDMLIGNIGAPSRLELTVISEELIGAFLMESLTKQHNVGTVVSGNALQSIAELSYPVRLLDLISTGQDQQPIEVYEILDVAEQQLYHSKLALQARFESAINQYREGTIESVGNARKEFLNLQSLCPADLSSAIYIARCDRYLEDYSESQDWSPVLHLSV